MTSAPGTDRRSAVVLLSGGLDSATCLAIARSEGRVAHCLSFDYGQRHGFELEACRRVAGHLGADSHRIASIDLRAFGGSALTSEGVDVHKDAGASAGSGGIPVTYVPARNTIFLSYALALAEVEGAGEVYIGVNAVDYSGYPDCRPEYIESFQRTADLATRAGVEGRGPRIVTPLIDLTKAQIIERGLALGVDYGQTHSCYDPRADGSPCERCDACAIRVRAFEALGMRDPLLV